MEGFCEKGTCLETHFTQLTWQRWDPEWRREKKEEWHHKISKEALPGAGLGQDTAQLAQCLPGRHEVLSSIPSTEFNSQHHITVVGHNGASLATVWSQHKIHLTLSQANKRLLSNLWVTICASSQIEPPLQPRDQSLNRESRIYISTQSWSRCGPAHHWPILIWSHPVSVLRTVWNLF